MGSAAAIAAVQRMQSVLRKLSSVPSQAAAEASDKISGLIQQQFDSGTDPYGNAWAPLMPSTVHNGRSAPPLTDTGAMRDFTVTPASGAGISIVAGASYSQFHQTGTRYMAQRKILPDQGLPPAWEEAISESVQAAIDRARG